MTQWVQTRATQPEGHGDNGQDDEGAHLAESGSQRAAARLGTAPAETQGLPATSNGGG